MATTQKTTRKQISKADREKARTGIHARQEAVKTLISRHQEEFDQLHVSSRLAAGLAPTNATPSREKLKARINKRKEMLARDEELLRVLS